MIDLDWRFEIRKYIKLTSRSEIKKWIVDVNKMYRSERHPILYEDKTCIRNSHETKVILWPQSDKGYWWYYTMSQNS